MRQGIKEKDIRDFRKYAEKLNQLMERIQKYNPEAHIMASPDTLALYGTYDDVSGKAYVENAEIEAIEEVFISGIDFGDGYWCANTPGTKAGY